MGRKAKWLMAAATVHLIIAALFSTHVHMERMLPPEVARPLTVYGGYTGASTHFNFFAPDVKTQARARFLVTDRAGATREVTLDTPSAEVNLRVETMLSFSGDPATRAFLMRAWCVYLLNRQVDAASVEARIELLDIPTLEELRRGSKPAWVELQRMTLRREEIS